MTTDPSAKRAARSGARPSTARQANIMIVDDHPIVRHGLVQLINQEPDLDVVAEAENARSAMTAVKEHQPDLVVVDLTLKDIGGMELIKQLRSNYEELPILVLSMHDENLYAERVLRAGAGGYVMKETASEKLVEAIRTVLRGEIYLSEKMASRVLGRMVGHRAATLDRSPIETLSDRELEVFEWIGRGLGTRQIAERLCVSVKTVESHREHIKEKLKLGSAPELVQHATRWVMQEGQ